MVEVNSGHNNLISAKNEGARIKETSP